MSIRQINFGFSLAFALTILSCQQIKSKGHQVATETKEVLNEKKDALVDKLLPQFDAATPDTKSNKQRFFEYFYFYPTSDVTNLYCYSDQLGIDASYWFAFECNDSTIQKIIAKLRLKLEPSQEYITTRDINGNIIDSILIFNNNGLSGGLNSNPTFWWDTAFINTSRPFIKSEGALYWILWYDKLNKKVYFLTFDT